MNKRIRAFFSMGAVSIFQILLNVIRSKLTAVLLGTYGIGLLSVINNIMGIGQTASNLGMGTGILKKISDDTNSKEEIENVISTSYITSVVSSTLVLILMIIFSKQVSIRNFDTAKYYKYIIIIAFSILITTFNSIDAAIINGFKEIRIISRVSILTSVANVISSVFFIYFLKIDGAIYSIIAMSIIGYAINFIALKIVLNKNNMKFRISFSKFKINILKTLITFGAITICSLLFSNVSMLLIKTTITKELGMEFNGIFQAVWAIMNQYIGIIFSSCAIYYFPTLCSLKTNEERIDEMNRTMEMLLLVIVPLFIGIMLFKNVIINLLYSKAFALSADLLSIFIIGDYFKVVAWTIGFVLVPINKLKEYIAIEFFANLFFTVASIVLLNQFGSLYGVAYAYVALNILLSITYYIYLRRKMDFHFKFYAKKIMTISFLILTACYVVIEFTTLKHIYQWILIFFIFALWMKLIMDKEKIAKIKKYLKIKFNKTNK